MAYVHEFTLFLYDHESIWDALERYNRYPRIVKENPRNIIVRAYAFLKKNKFDLNLGETTEEDTDGGFANGSSYYCYIEFETEEDFLALALSV